MSDQVRIAQLIDKYTAGEATPAELETLALLLEEPAAEEIAKDHLLQLLRQTSPLSEHSEIRWQVIQEEIRRGTASLQLPGESTSPEQPAKRGLLHLMTRNRVRWSAAAVLVLGLSAWFWMRPKTSAPAPVMTTAKADRLPGGNIAVLTLSDGSTIVLDSAQNGTLAHQGNTSIAKLANGQLAYNSLNEKPTTILYNTLSTPRGGQYKIILPDGTAVWLNAASSITYPTAFTGANRTVRVTGEAYFEVAKDVAKPFKVQFALPADTHSTSDTGTIEVLGTQFNINAYTDEEMIRTTLLQGSVRVVNKNATLLKPGQQLALDKQGTATLNPDANVEEAIAWKNGNFNFEYADIKTVMRQLARWYDVDIIYQGNITTEKFVGEIPRNSKLTEVFKILELSNVHFKVEDRKVTVMP